MEYLWLTPVVIASVLGLAVELEQMSYEVVDETAEFASSASSAIECAYQARPLTECSPELFSSDVSDEIARTHAMLAHFE